MTDISRRRLLGGSLAGGAAMLAGVAHAAEAEVPEKRCDRGGFWFCWFSSCY